MKNSTKTFSAPDREMTVRTPCGQEVRVRSDGRVALAFARSGGPGPTVGRIQPDPIVGFAWLARPLRHGTLRARTLPNAVALLVRAHRAAGGAS